MTRRPRVLFFGESHVHAVQTALRKNPEILEEFEVSLYRLTKIKNGRLIGDIHLDDFKLLCADLDSRDLVVSLVGGNQHSSFSLIQHEQPFDVIAPDAAADTLADNVQIIPHNTIRAQFERGMRSNDLRRIFAVAKSGKMQTVHLSPPPPKEDEAHILRKIEAAFTARGISEKGVSPAPLRLRIWDIQCKVLAEVLPEGSVQFLPPPDGSQTPQGYLHPDFYAADATHANTAYGVKLLHQLRKFTSTLQTTPA